MIRSVRISGALAIVSAVAALGAGTAGVAAARDADHGNIRGAITASQSPRMSPRRTSVALVSRYGPRSGRYVVRPSRLNLIYGYRSDVAAAHLRWVDWGQPVAFATGDILIQTSSGGFESVPGALVLYQLTACGTKPTSYYTAATYTAATAYTPSYPQYTAIGTGKPGLASPC